MIPDLLSTQAIEARIQAAAILLEDTVEDIKREGHTPYLVNKALVILNIIITYKSRLGKDTDREDELKELLQRVRSNRDNNY